MSDTNTLESIQKQQARLAWRRHLLRGLIRLIGFRFIRVETLGLENIPPTVPAILMMNHISGLDPVACMAVVTHRFVVPLGKAELASNPAMVPFVKWWGGLLVKRGEVDRKGLTETINLTKSGQLVLIAPEGTRHPEGLSRPKDGLVFVATKADAVIIPAAINYARDWKTRLKGFKRGRLTVSFGRPFKFKADDGRVSKEDRATMMDEAMYQLALAIVEPDIRGFYSDTENATTRFIEFVDVAPASVTTPAPALAK